MNADPKTIAIALLAGIVPALLWLWFWIKEDNDHPEPKGLLFLTFILGMISVFAVLPLQKLTGTLIEDKNTLTIIWVIIEEFAKFGAVALIALKSKFLEEPVDYAIYFITAALGFAALENSLFLIEPISLADNTVSLLTGNLRFLGATLLHAVASSTIGIALGLAYYQNKFIKNTALVLGLISAISLHSLFNFFIIKNEGENFLNIFGVLWVFTIIIMLLFEKLRRMRPTPLTELNVSNQIIN